MPEQTPAVKITVDGEVFLLDFSDLTALDSRDFRREVGVALPTALSDGADADELSVAAGLVWLARRKNEPKLTYEQVAAGFTFLTDIGLAHDEEPSPEA